MHAPSFGTIGEYQAALQQPQPWLALLHAISERHSLEVMMARARPGEGGTYPTLVVDDLVVKLFGYLPNWRMAYAAERAAMALVAQDPGLLAPRMVASGALFPLQAQAWPYLVTTRMAGLPWHKAGLNSVAKQRVAQDLGSQIARYQGLQSAAVQPPVGSASGLVDAATRSSLPPHLLPQLADYFSRYKDVGIETDKSFVHGDLIYRHVFVERGRLAGIIDWGDATLIDRHYELVQIQLNLFDRDFSLLQALLEAADWQPDIDFPYRCLTMAVQRQAHGLTQHPSMDVFYKLPNWLDGTKVPDLETLAVKLFGTGRRWAFK